MMWFVIIFLNSAEFWTFLECCLCYSSFKNRKKHILLVWRFLVKRFLLGDSFELQFLFILYAFWSNHFHQFREHILNVYFQVMNNLKSAPFPSSHSDNTKSQSNLLKMAKFVWFAFRMSTYLYQLSSVHKGKDTPHLQKEGTKCFAKLHLNKSNGKLALTIPSSVHFHYPQQYHFWGCYTADCMFIFKAMGIILL